MFDESPRIIPRKPAVPLENQELRGWRLRESEYAKEVGAYFKRLDQTQRDSFAPIGQMIPASLNGSDLHVITMVNRGEEPSADTINALAIFNQEANASKTSNGTSAIKVVLHHVSAIHIEQRNSVFDQVLEYIWKNMHCSAIRVPLFHLKDKKTGQLKADPDLKELFKSRKFKWKTIMNDDTTGQRSEIQEVANTFFINQMRRSKAEIFRRGLSKEDILREPVSVYFSSMVAFGVTEQAINQANLPKTDI